MEQNKQKVGPVTYVITRKFTGERPIKEVLLEKMLSEKEPHSTALV